MQAIENEELVSELNQTPINFCGPSGPEWADGRGGFDPKWATETVRVLAKGIDVDQAFDRMPILADALEEAGCDDPALLWHCRACPVHSPHCWVLWMIREVPQPKPPLPTEFVWPDDPTPSYYANQPGDRSDGAVLAVLGIFSLLIIVAAIWACYVLKVGW